MFNFIVIITFGESRTNKWSKFISNIKNMKISYLIQTNRKIRKSFNIAMTCSSWLITVNCLNYSTNQHIFTDQKTIVRAL